QAMLLATKLADDLVMRRCRLAEGGGLVADALLPELAEFRDALLVDCCDLARRWGGRCGTCLVLWPISICGGLLLLRRCIHLPGRLDHQPDFCHRLGHQRIVSLPFEC